MVNGLLGVIIFSGSLPATRVASSIWIPFSWRSWERQLPVCCHYADLRLSWKTSASLANHAIIIVSLGVILGFPLLTAMALNMWPLPTQSFFWVFCRWVPRFWRPAGWWAPQDGLLDFFCVGSLLVMGFAFSQSTAVSPTVIFSWLLRWWPAAWVMPKAQANSCSGRMAGHQLVIDPLAAFMLSASFITMPATFADIGLLPGSHWVMSPCSACWLVLFSVQGTCNGWDCCRRSATTPSAFFGLGLSAILLHEAVSPLMCSSRLVSSCALWALVNFPDKVQLTGLIRRVGSPEWKDLSQTYGSTQPGKQRDGRELGLCQAFFWTTTLYPSWSIKVLHKFFRRCLTSLEDVLYTSLDIWKCCLLSHMKQDNHFRGNPSLAIATSLASSKMFLWPDSWHSVLKGP